MLECRADGSTSRTFCSQSNKGYFVDVDVKLCQPVKNQLSLINEDLRLVLQKFLAILLHLLWHGGAEHEHLFVVRRLDEDILNVCSHLWVSQNFIALINNEELALSQI